MHRYGRLFGLLTAFADLASCVPTASHPPDGLVGDVEDIGQDVDDRTENRTEDALSDGGWRDPGIDNTPLDASPEGLPTPGNLEFCNERDDDGDGRTDEGLWCWLSPGPLGLEVIRGIWGSRYDDVWIVSGMGTLAHWDGRRWSSTCSGVASDLHALWGLAADNVWAVGENGTVLHWNGAAWSSVPTGTSAELHGVWGAAPDDVWAVGGTPVVGDGDLILHWDGRSWSEFPGWRDGSLGLHAVYGFAADDVWAVGGDVIEHWDGESWTGRPIDPPDTLRAVWGAAADDVWAAGSEGSLWHWNGTAWTRHGPLGGRPDLRALWGASSSDVWVVGAGEPHEWSSARLAHWDGHRWDDSVDVRSGTALDGLNAIWGSAADDVWAVGHGGRFFRLDDAGWRVFEERRARYGQYNDIWVSAPDDVWIAGGFGFPAADLLLHWDGASFTEVPLPMQEGEEYGVGALWGFARDDVWAAPLEPGLLLHWDGSAWSRLAVAAERYLGALWGSAPDNIWLGGGGGTLRRWDGATWTAVTVPGALWFHGFWGSAADDVWASGAEGALGHWDGVRWTWLPPRSRYALHLWGTSSSDVWAVASESTVLHWDGTTWTTRVLPEPLDLVGVWGSHPDDYWATVALWGRPDDSRVLHWDGSSWSLCPCVAGNSSNLVGGIGDDVWIAGYGGQIGRRRE